MHLTRPFSLILKRKDDSYKVGIIFLCHLYVKIMSIKLDDNISFRKRDMYV